jgi:predicted RNA-binding Zn ribbon-like protein
MALPTWVPASESKPAPEPLLLVQAFVNTKEADLGTDLLADDPAAANRWLRESGLLGPDGTATEAELRVAREVREGIRGMLVRNAGGSPALGRDVQALEAVTREAKLRLTIGPHGQVELAAEPAGRLAAGLLRLLLIIRDAQHDGTWARLKACGNQDCRWAFFDRSHGRLGTWCDMASCGNLIKNRNLRARRGSQARPGR